MTLGLSEGQLTAAESHLGALLPQHMDPRSGRPWYPTALMHPPLSAGLAGGWAQGATWEESDSHPKVTVISRSTQLKVTGTPTK